MNQHGYLIDDTQMPWFHGNISREKTEKYSLVILIVRFVHKIR